MFKVAALIDWGDLRVVSSLHGFTTDFRRLLEWLKGQVGRDELFLRAHFFALTDETDGHVNLKPLADWLTFNGYTVTTKPAKFDGSGRPKNSIKMELAMEASFRLGRSISHVILFAGDGDYVALVKCLKSQGVKVTLVSTIYGSPSHVSDELRRTSDVFIDIADLKEKIQR